MKDDALTWKALVSATAADEVQRIREENEKLRSIVRSIRNCLDDGTLLLTREESKRPLGISLLAEIEGILK